VEYFPQAPLPDSGYTVNSNLATPHHAKSLTSQRRSVLKCSHTLSHQHTHFDVRTILSSPSLCHGRLYVNSIAETSMRLHWQYGAPLCPAVERRILLACCSGSSVLWYHSTKVVGNSPPSLPFSCPAYALLLFSNP
jgi:hypothetical protein